MSDPKATPGNQQQQTEQKGPTGNPPKKPMSRAEAISILKLAANRLNAQKSTGPTSDEGKERTKYNARRHGFTGQVLLMTVEETPLFNAFVAGMMKEFAPVGTHETFLANSIAEDSWRLNQMRARCNNIEAVCTFEGAGKHLHLEEGTNHQVEDAVVDAAIARDRAKELSLISTYMQRTQRACEKHKKELRELQEERKAHRAQELEEARLLFQLADTEGVKWDPKDDGFDFSLAEVKLHTHRHHMLQKARRREKDYRDHHYPVEITRSAGKAA